MSTEEIRATLTLCLMAAYADGDKHDREREQIRQVAEGLAQDAQVNLPGLYQDVLLRRVNLPDVLSRLQGDDARQVAYEMAVCVCDADGQTSPRERAFLDQVRDGLGMGAAAATQARTADPSAFADQAESLATAPLQSPPVAVATVPVPEVVSAGLPVPHPAAVDQLQSADVAAPKASGKVPQAEMDRKILNASILNGAIELLPENLSTLAIIPLQMRLVYQVGQNYGYELDSGHIKDLLATLGVGLTSQYLEQAGRKLLGGLLGKAGKGLLGGLGKQAVSSGMSFASTYALGHVANQYYAGGRTLSTQMLKDAYAHVMSDGKNLQARYLPQMQETARGLNTAKILSMVRGG
ncbi:TerB family tellurite resistance protein [Variovorax dokdonensis]|uniref:TerB family tellurite resistance protein n=1 Tax=Variovorax dokdonensis TaxID=344883 RepID=A0ABT7N8L1_9BURK|nr:TerB family tellurite resistance protein [Variovorax dokdonensis]MDM0044272.1 TerB family tellurite resistance protein [Variovorax dokdonensis]